jgi:Family of unknown function (DUF6174)
MRAVSALTAPLPLRHAINWLALTLVASLGLAGCSALLGHNDAVAQELVLSAQENRKLWSAQIIDHYEVNYLLIEGDDGAPEAYRVVKVRNNAVLDTTCPFGKCPSLHLRDLRTIPELFNLIVDNAELCDIGVTYHSMLHFPSYIRANCGRSGKPDFRVIVRGLAANP